MKFLKHYALEIYTVVALSLLVGAALMGELTMVQKLVVIDAYLFVLHEWEEARYPGGFIDLISGLLQLEVSDELHRASRLPAGVLLLVFSVVPFVFHDVPLLTVAVAAFGILEGVVHTVGIRLFRMKTFYTPGMVTAWMELAVGVTMIVYLVVHGLGRWVDYVGGPLLMLACFALLQKTMTLMVGIRYSDMPKIVRRQWRQR